MVLAFLLALIGLVVLVGGADQAVGGARRAARRLGVSELIIGLTLTSIGTSLPELATSAAAALASEGPDAAAGVAVGNLLGSNLFLLTALLAASAFTRTIQVDRNLLRRDGVVLVVATLATLAVMADRTVGPWEGAGLLGGYGLFLLLVARHERQRMAAAEDGGPSNEAGPPEAATSASDAAPVGAAARLPPWVVDGLKVVLGLGGVLLGAELIVDNGVAIATEIGVPGTLIGIFVGVGTSLPELVVSIQAALRGASDISLGNIIGSAITNLLLCLGAAALVHPIGVPETALTFDLPFTLAATIISLALMTERRDVTRAEGVALATLFLLYLYLRAAGVVA